MTLRQLIEGLAGARLIGDAEVAVRTVRDDSRQVEPGDVFVAVRGIRSDGHAFVQTAIERGAAAVVVEHEGLGVTIPQVIVPSGRQALAELVGRSLGDPAKAMTLIGITGTNGKTTTTYLVEAILRASGARPGVIGTVEYRWDGGSIEAPYTTPTPQILHGAFAQMRDAGCTHVVMEVTSSALAMDRVAGLTFAVAAFSNLTQDHLDVHGSMAAYRDAKMQLFANHLANGTAVINVDDREGETMAKASPGRVLRVSIEGNFAQIRMTSQTSSVRGITARIATPGGELDIVSKPLIGHYNVANLALAIGIAEALGISHEAISRGIAELAGVPGRVERVLNDGELDILVDYAHTPDALRNLLSALRPLTKRRLICVFGCGGDRDPGKREKMGAAVAELADLAVVTSDNPRTEEPRKIIDQILPAVPKPFFVDVDRRTAIRAAIAEATPGDVVVIAGKGHEDYQILGTTKIHFDDREEAAAAVKMRERRTLAQAANDLGLPTEAEPSDQGVDDPRFASDRRSISGPRAPRELDAAYSRIVIDSRIVATGDLYVAIHGESHDGHAFCEQAIAAGAVGLVVDHPVEVPAPQIVATDTRGALGGLARAHRKRWSARAGDPDGVQFESLSESAQTNQRIVAITGSAGKTTTKELVRAALAEVAPTQAADGSLNNETGVPLTLLGLRPFHRFGVIEMGMRGLGQIAYLTRIARPDVAVVLNAGTAHIELLGSEDKIAEAKGEIWLGLRDNGTIVRPADDDRLAHWAHTHRKFARTVLFGEIDRADIRLVRYESRDFGGEIEIDAFGERKHLQLGLVGRHAAVDACAALAAAHAAGASIDQALIGLARARPPSMRGEVIQVAGRNVIVDCYNANPASMAAALRTLAERAHGKTAVAVLGDMLELGEHAPRMHAEVGALARELGVLVIALGEHAGSVIDAAGPKAEFAATPAEAAASALRRAGPGDTILLKASRGIRLERVLEAMKAGSAV